MLESRKKTKPEKCFSKPQTPKNPLHALLGNLTERQTRLPQKDHTANLINFYTQHNFWQLPKRTRLTKTLADQRLLPFEKTTMLIEADLTNQTEHNVPKLLTKEIALILET